MRDDVLKNVLVGVQAMCLRTSLLKTGDILCDEYEVSAKLVITLSVGLARMAFCLFVSFMYIRFNHRRYGYLLKTSNRRLGGDKS